MAKNKAEKYKPITGLSGGREVTSVRSYKGNATGVNKQGRRIYVSKANAADFDSKVAAAYAKQQRAVKNSIKKKK
jgi:hypothetical protein